MHRFLMDDKWDNGMDLIEQLKINGIDFLTSEYEEEEEFVEDVRSFLHSYEFMQLGQAVNRKQWQAAGMKIQKMSAKAKKMGMIGWEHQFTGIKQNIARKNEKEALQIVSLITNKRVKLLQIL